MKKVLSFFLSFFLFEQKINCKINFKEKLNNSLTFLLKYPKKYPKITSVSFLVLFGLSYIKYKKNKKSQQWINDENKKNTDREKQQKLMQLKNEENLKKESEDNFEKKLNDTKNGIIELFNKCTLDEKKNFIDQQLNNNEYIDLQINELVDKFNVYGVNEKKNFICDKKKFIDEIINQIKKNIESNKILDAISKTLLKIDVDIKFDYLILAINCKINNILLNGDKDPITFEIYNRLK